MRDSFPQAAGCREVTPDGTIFLRGLLMGSFTQSKLCSRKLEQAPAFQIRRFHMLHGNDEATVRHD
jgi:hypothetical protein